MHLILNLSGLEVDPAGDIYLVDGVCYTEACSIACTMTYKQKQYSHHEACQPCRKEALDILQASQPFGTLTLVLLAPYRVQRPSGTMTYYTMSKRYSCGCVPFSAMQVALPHLSSRVHLPPYLTNSSEQVAECEGPEACL